MKDIFKPEDFEFTSENGSEIFNYVNKILEDRLKLGYTYIGKDETAYDISWICKAKDDGDNATPVEDNHKIYFFTEPLEEEKVECDCVNKYIALSNIGAVSMANFCPKCGEKLQ